MSGTYLTPGTPQALRLLAVSLSLLAGAAQAATASGIDGLSLDTVIPRIDQSNSHQPAKAFCKACGPCFHKATATGASPVRMPWARFASPTPTAAK